MTSLCITPKIVEHLLFVSLHMETIPDANDGSREAHEPRGAGEVLEKGNLGGIEKEKKLEHTFEALVPAALTNIEATAEELGYTDRELGDLLIRAHGVAFLATLDDGTELEAMQVSLENIVVSLMRMQQIRLMAKVVVSQLCGEGMVLHESANGGDPVVTKIMQDIRSQLFDLPSAYMDGQLPKEVSRTEIYTLVEQAYKKLVRGEKEKKEANKRKKQFLSEFGIEFAKSNKR